MAKETILTYDMSETPKYIRWKKLSGNIVYYEPVIFKQQNELYPDAYIGMYARCFFRNNVTRYRKDEYLFRVEGPTIAETLERFGKRLQQLQAAEVIQGRHLCADKVDFEHRELLNDDLYHKLWNERIKSRKY